jgi:hypothetical protein
MRLTLELAWLIASAEAETLDADTANQWLESVAAEFQASPTTPSQG